MNNLYISKKITFLLIFILILLAPRTYSQVGEVSNDNNKENQDTVLKQEKLLIKIDKSSNFVPVDSVIKGEIKPDKPPKNPKLATILSAAVPGAGQIYNGKWWKVPIIYGSFYGLYVIAGNYDDVYQKLKFDYNVVTGYFEQEVKFRFFPYASEKELQYFMQRYRRKRDLSYIGIFMVYIFNIIDANVDANLSNFDVSTDLTVGLKPDIITTHNGLYTTGLTISLKF